MTQLSESGTTVYICTTAFIIIKSIVKKESRDDKVIGGDTRTHMTRQLQRKKSFDNIVCPINTKYTCVRWINMWMQRNYFSIVISCIGLCICMLRFSEGYSCVIHHECCLRKVTELAHRDWKKHNVWMQSKIKKIIKVHLKSHKICFGDNAASSHTCLPYLCTPGIMSYWWWNSETSSNWEERGKIYWHVSWVDTKPPQNNYNTVMMAITAVI